jgi:hypothetical protein
MMVRFLKVLFLLLVGNSLGNRLRKLSRDNPRRAGKGRGLTGNGAKHYSAQSDRLWEDAGIAAGYKIAYKSEEINKDGNPVFTKQGEEPLLISPEIRPRVSGCYRAIPGGLRIDQQTGQIDINNSDTGIRYKIEFTPCGQRYAAQTVVVMKGIFFQGGIFSLSRSEALTSRPWYYAGNPQDEVPTNNVPAGRFGYIPENVKPTANLVGLQLEESTGEIDLRKTIASGALGFRKEGGLPANGASKEFKVYYDLVTNQNKEVLNYTTLRIHFYDTEADIPEELLVRLKQQRNSIFQKEMALPLLLGMPFFWFRDSPWEGLAALAAALSSLLFLNAGSSNNPLRPPEHVVTT